MSTDMSEDRLDRDLRRFLERQAGELHGSPSSAEMTARVAAAVGRRPVTQPSRQLIWIVALLGLLLAALIAVVIGSQENKKVAVVLSSPTTSPTSPTPSALIGRCVTPIELHPAFDAPAPNFQNFQVPAGGRLAFADVEAEVPAIWLESGDTPGAETVATITGYGLTILPHGDVGAQVPQVRVLGWSADGSAFLVETSLIHVSLPGPNCRNLFLVKADGSSVTKLTDNGPDQEANGAALAPDGRSVAYLEYAGSRPELRLTDLSGAARVLDSADCQSVAEGLLWSPNGSRLARLCGANVTVYSIGDGTSRTIALPPGLGATTGSWSADGSRFLVAANSTNSVSGPQRVPLSILSLDPDTGTAALLSRSTLSTYWSPLQIDAISPDGAWLYAIGVPPEPLASTSYTIASYLINVASGVTHRLVGPALSPGEPVWLPDSSGLIFVDTSAAIERVPIDGGTATPLGSVQIGSQGVRDLSPESWYWTGR
jgi:hypothetical protein